MALDPKVIVLVAALYDDNGKPSPLLKTCVTHFKDRFREVLKKLGAASNVKTKSGSSTDDKGSALILEASFPVENGAEALKQATALTSRLHTPTMKGAGIAYSGAGRVPHPDGRDAVVGYVGMEVNEAAGQLNLKASLIVLHPDVKILKVVDKAPEAAPVPAAPKVVAPKPVSEGPFPAGVMHTPSTYETAITTGLPDFVEEVKIGPWGYVTVVLKYPTRRMAISFESAGGKTPANANSWWNACVVPAFAFCKKHFLPLLKKGNPYPTGGSSFSGRSNPAIANTLPTGPATLYRGYNVVRYQEARDLRIEEAAKVVVTAGKQPGWGKPYPATEVRSTGVLVNGNFLETNDSIGTLVSKWQTDWPVDKFPQIMVDVKAKRITFRTNQVAELYPSLLEDKSVITGKADEAKLTALVEKAKADQAKALEKAKADKAKADKALEKATKGLTAEEVNRTLKSSGLFETYNWDWDGSGFWSLEPSIGRNRDGYDWDDLSDSERRYFDKLSAFIRDNFGKRVTWADGDKGWLEIQFS